MARPSEADSQNQNHMENWIDCIRSRGMPNAPPEIGYRSAIAVHMANLSYKNKQRLTLGGSESDYAGILDAVPAGRSAGGDMQTRTLQFRFLVFAAFLFLSLAPVASAQDTATLTGTVRDNTGAVIPGATVTVKNMATGIDP